MKVLTVKFYIRKDDTVSVKIKLHKTLTTGQLLRCLGYASSWLMNYAFRLGESQKLPRPVIGQLMRGN